MVSAMVSSQQGFEKNYSKIRSYPPDSELHVGTVWFSNLCMGLCKYIRSQSSKIGPRSHCQETDLVKWNIKQYLPLM